MISKWLVYYDSDSAESPFTPTTLFACLEGYQAFLQGHLYNTSLVINFNVFMR